MFHKANHKKMKRMSTGFYLLNTGKMSFIEEGLMLLFNHPEYDEEVYRKTSDPELWLFRALIGKRQKKLSDNDLIDMLKQKNLIKKLTTLSQSKHYPTRLTTAALNLISDLNTYQTANNIERILTT
jgi:ribosomal protein L20